MLREISPPTSSQQGDSSLPPCLVHMLFLLTYSGDKSHTIQSGLITFRSNYVMVLCRPQNRGRGGDSWTSDENSSRMALLTARQNEVVSGSLPVETELERPGRALKDNRRDDEGAGNAEKALVAVTVSVQSGLQFQQHFLASETLQNVATWGLHSKAIASDDSEEFLILQPAVRFTPSNLKRTLAELRLPRSVVLSVVKRTKKSAEAFAKAAAELSAHEAGEPSKKNGRAYSPPGAPV
jgi:hypothetical protein